MNASRRLVEAEILDEMDPADPRARRSRRDLQRIHRFMGTLLILRRAASRLSPRPQRILELGAGDGTLLLRLARAMHTQWPDVELTLLDRQDLITGVTHEAYRQLGWRVSVITADVVDWARAPGTQQHDLCVTTLFLHHFEQPHLGEVLAAVAARSRAFIACEPRRNAWGWVGSRLVGATGGNRVTRSDAITSVAAGFSGKELSMSWPDGGPRWHLEESQALLFTHRFVALRASAGATDG
jgi:hypothetical protein